MKTKEELNALKEEAETASRKPHALSDEKLEQIIGGKWDREADIWLSKHYEALNARASEKNLWIDNILYNYETSEKFFSLDEIKSRIGKYFNIDDLV